MITIEEIKKKKRIDALRNGFLEFQSTKHKRLDWRVSGQKTKSEKSQNTKWIFFLEKYGNEKMLLGSECQA